MEHGVMFVAKSLVQLCGALSEMDGD